MYRNVVTYEFTVTCTTCGEPLYTRTRHPDYVMVWCQEEDGFSDWPSGKATCRYCLRCFGHRSFEKHPLPVIVAWCHWYSKYRRYYPAHLLNANPTHTVAPPKRGNDGKRGWR